MSLYEEVKKEIDNIKEDKNLKKEQKEEKINQILESKKKDIEEKVVNNCIVEDIGGFLITDQELRINIRRTSAFQVSYVIPTEDAIEEASTTDIQMQVRMAPTALSLAQSVNNQSNYKMIQTPYNKEIASTTYSFIFNFDADKVGVSAITNSLLLDNNERIRRAKLLLDALKLVLDGQFGASKSRYHPFISREFILAAVSKGDVLFTVSSPAMKLEDFIRETIERAVTYVKEFGIDIKLYAWIDSSFDEKFSANKKLSGLIKEIFKGYGNNPEEKDNTIYIKIKSANEEKTLPLTIIVSKSHANLIEKLEEEIEIG